MDIQKMCLSAKIIVHKFWKAKNTKITKLKRKNLYVCQKKIEDKALSLYTNLIIVLRIKIVETLNMYG